MKQYKQSDEIPWAGHTCIMLDEPWRDNLVDSPLPWQKMGLQQTASGYGGKLTTTWKIHYEGRLYRVYCTCYSNVGSCWFTTKGRKIFVN